MQNRCESLLAKASSLAARNSATRLAIDDLRKSKQMHTHLIERHRQKAVKVEEDIAFLTQSAHAALDQREKVKGKFMAAQRDMQQEREQKLGMIHDLIERATSLNGDWGLRKLELADAEEALHSLIATSPALVYLQ